jgi:nucleoside-diphosphate-sugar epimerase
VSNGTDDSFSAAALLRNFLGGLEQANLKPKRVLLQTGAKHYGFHMGPANSPSFETDPRITLENNFYYPQEDLLFDYCQRNSAEWNVVRPSYIIGAVRDNLLNHMVGFAVYGAVQAHLRRPLHFPGDYVAWDREHCQSTAMLNAYLEEWAVLSPNTGNESFNVQDGLPFTWGRFWPYLAKWYGTSWTPPEMDASKYKETSSRHDQNPRG